MGFSALGPDFLGDFALSLPLAKANAFAEIQSRTRHDISLIALSAMMVLGLKPSSEPGNSSIGRSEYQLDAAEPMALFGALIRPPGEQDPAAVLKSQA